MIEQLKMIINDDGVFEEYDDAWDVTIHCENEEEQKNVIEKLNMRWILCSEQMPEERESIFAKLKGTNKWSSAMFETTSNDVIVAVRFKETKETMTGFCHTCDKKWKKPLSWKDAEIVAWMPLPKYM